MTKRALTRQASGHTGELTSIDYSDTGAGADLQFTYTRLGQVATVTDADPTGTNCGFDYSQWPEQVTEDITGLYSQTIVREYDAAAGGRLAGLTVLDGQAQEVYAAGYEYAATGRMSRVTGPGLPAFGAVYGYMLNGSEEPGADLVTTIDLRSDANNTVARTVRSYEAHRNLIGLVQNVWEAGETPVTVSKYEYVSDILGRRTSVVYTGSAFAQDHLFKWGYNGRNELTGANQHAGNNPANPGAQFTQYGDFDYAHDNIGNRVTSALDGTGTTYTSNDLNQYTAITPPQPAATLDYDDDGNMTMDDRGMVYEYDAENRLTAVAKLSPGAGDKKVAFAYDYMGRRVRKQVFAWNTGSAAWSTSPESDLRFVYDGWRVVLELDGLNADAVTRKYTWGLDLAGQSGGAGVSPANAIEGAGGIGGLLASYDTAGTTTTTDDRTFLYTYDANGNVGQLVEMTSGANYGALAAKYEYDPYGSAIVAAGNYAAANPYRFSTKPFDGLTGQGYWGQRWYDPRLGRWTTRDPIEEPGAVIPRQGGPRPFAHLGDGTIGYARDATPANLSVLEGADTQDVLSPEALDDLQGPGRLPREIARYSGEYMNGINLYRYVLNDPARFSDPQGANIYLKQGNDSGNPINDLVHQNVCVDSCADGTNGIVCFSFGKIGWAWYWPKTTWLGWSSLTAGGYLMEGEIYPADDTGTVLRTKTTTPRQDERWANWMKTRREKLRDVYSVARHNCRKYAQMEFADAPGNH